MAVAKGRRVSSQDVADAAGVSRTTVSFVLNDRPNAGIPESTRERVWAAARELGFTPSPEARALRLGRSAVVLCLLPDWPIAGPFGELLQRLSAELDKAGLTMLAHQRGAGDDLSNVLGALTPTAVVAMCDLSVSEVKLAEQRDIPITAYMGRVPEHDDVSALKQTEIGRLQASTLVDDGHHVLAYVSPHDRRIDWFSAPRLAGAQQEASKRDVQLSHFRLPADDRPAVRGWLNQAVAEGVTGICAFNDEAAFALMMAAADEGLAVPDDISLIGVDDSALSRLTRPTITTISFELAHQAEQLVAIITDTQADQTQQSAADPLTLQRRESVRKL